MKTKTIKYTQRLQKLNRNISREDLVFKIKEFIQSIDARPLERLLRCTGRGPRPYPLWIPLSVWLFAYLNGIQEYRKVSELCKTDDRFYWLSSGFEPSPAYFERWKLLLFPLLTGLLRSYQRYLHTHHLNPTEVLGLDGMKVAVWASVRQSKTESQIDRELKKIQEKLYNPYLEARLLRQWQHRLEKLFLRKWELATRKALSPNKGAKDKARMRINITSPDTVLLVKKPNRHFIQGVNVQVICNQAQVINVLSVERASTDNVLLWPMYQKACEFFGQQPLPWHLLVDSGYWNVEAIKTLDVGRGYKIIMPSQDLVARNRHGRCGARRKGSWGMEHGFRLDEATNEIVCPNKKILCYGGIRQVSASVHQRQYSARTADCQACPFVQDCLGQVKARCKHMALPYTPEAVSRMKAYYALPQHSALYQKRQTLNEPVNGQLLHNLGISKLHSLSGPCLDGEMALIALIHTMKKIQKLHGAFMPVSSKLAIIFFCFSGDYFKTVANQSIGLLFIINVEEELKFILSFV